MLRVSVQTVHRWIDEGRLEALQIGRVVRITPQALDQMLQENTVGTKKESNEDEDSDSDTITIPQFAAA